MHAKQKSKLKKMGGRVTTAQAFLGLSDAESAIVEIRLQLSTAVREHRLHRGMSQAELAKSVGSSQARIAKLEGGDSQASIESMIRALVATGGKIKLKVA